MLGFLPIRNPRAQSGEHNTKIVIAIQYGKSNTIVCSNIEDRQKEEWFCFGVKMENYRKEDPSLGLEVR